MIKVKKSLDKLVEINDNVIDLMISYRQDTNRDLEAGGMLFGRILLTNSNVIIDRATEPLPDDKRGRFFFKRTRDRAQLIVNAIWEESEGTCIYLGEWHTHPEDDPSPSSQDIKNWKNLLKNTVYNQDFLLFIIVGRKKIRIWEGNKQLRAILELSDV